jgi:hypothetical protein
MFATILKSKLGCDIVFYPVSKLIDAIKNNQIDIALVPPLDLHNGVNLAVSGIYGIVSDSVFSNSYLYFKPGEKEVTAISMKGDISFHDITLLRIIFKELYGILPEITPFDGDVEKVSTLYVAGDENYITLRYENGMNLTEETIECLQYYTPAYILVSNKEEILESVHSKIKQMNDDLYSFGSDFIATSGISIETLEYLSDNLHHVSFELNDDILEGLKNLIALPYYYNLAEDIPEFSLV